MKKSCCIILALFLLIMVPVRGYAASAPLVFGIGEEIILPFLLSLLGVQAKESIDSYDDLVTYNDDIETELTSLAGSEAVMYFVQRAVQGLIDTDSIVWQKLYEYAMRNYVVVPEGTIVPSDNVLGLAQFSYATLSTYIEVTSGLVYRGTEQCSFVWTKSNNFYSPLFASSSSTFRGQVYRSYSKKWADIASSSYTYDERTVYYYYNTSGSANAEYNPSIFNENTDFGKSAWLMVYGNYLPSSSNTASYSDAFSNVLSSEDKESLVDGSNVIQLYNPSTYQNGLNMIEGGDGEDDPNLKNVPAILTADWWNFLQQFGQGENDNQYVNAYNALNAIDGGSVGNVSDAYDSLGLASVISDAVNAALGKMSLEDLNIYPDSLSVAQTIDDSIPPSLTPVAPNEGINNESDQGLYKLPDLRDYFPFCIPFDLVDLLSCFVAEPETPSFVIALSDGDNMVEGQMDLHIWDNIASVIRTFELIGFTVGLILITRNIIRG